MSKAIITGVTGQVGSYMADFLLEKGYDVVGLKRRTASGSLWRLEKALKHKNFRLVEGELCDNFSCFSLLKKENPSEIYNFAAMSHVRTSFEQPDYTFQVNTNGVLNLLESIRILELDCKMYQSSTSEMFGNNITWYISNWMKSGIHNITSKELPLLMEDIQSGITKVFQDENTPFNPQSPYAVSKLAAHNLVKLYREAYNIWVVGGIMFNTESPRRGINFVTRKIISHFSMLKNGFQEKLKLGNLDSFRDWSYAPESVEAIWLMLQQSTPREYVIGTGKTYTVKDFLQEVINLSCPNYSINELVDIDNSLRRPCEVPYLCCQPDKINTELGWKAKTTFKELVKLMVEQENGKE